MSFKPYWVQPDDTVAVWFSCGAASAVAAKLTLDRYRGTGVNVRVLNNYIAEEDADNVRFKHDVAKWLGVEIETVASKRYPKQSCVEVWNTRKFMSGPMGAPCTIELKKYARQVWEHENNPNWHVLGFTADELTRHKRFTLTERSNVIPVLIEAGYTKGDCFRYLLEAEIELPRLYKDGYPNANCIGCVKATSPTYWNLVRNKHPAVFDERAEQSRRLGARLVRYAGERIFLDELPANAVGQPLKNMDIECGIFCEEREQI